MQKFVPPPRTKHHTNNNNNNNNNSNNNNSNFTTNNNKNIIISHDENNKVHHIHPEKQKQLPQLPLRKKTSQYHKINDWHHHHHHQQQQQQQQQQHQQHHHHHQNSSKEIQPPKVKLSGYLKKKRNKVGGWRKMWFVLQDQLLLSYSSKEEYDKKLVSFKDIINIVPGTVVQPLNGGARFTIETTSSQLYTFRCDDAKACTEWITALSESLALKSISTKDLNTVGLPQKSLNKSMDNIQQSRKSKIKTIRNSQSCDSIVRNANRNFNSSSNNCKQLSTLPTTTTTSATTNPTARIPIAESTARILERNGGVSSNGGLCTDNKKQHKIKAGKFAGTNEQQNFCEYLKSSNQQIVDERAQNFRLHEKRLSSGAVLLNQSDEVCRINRMFSKSATNVRLNSSSLASVITTSTVTTIASNGNNNCNKNLKTFRAINSGCLIQNHKQGNQGIYCSCSNCNQRNYFGKLEKPKIENLKNLDTFYLMATTKSQPVGAISERTNGDHNKCNDASDELRELIRKLENNCYCCVDNDNGSGNGNITCNCGMNLNNGSNGNNKTTTVLTSAMDKSKNWAIEEQTQRLSLNETTATTTAATILNKTTNYSNSNGSRTRQAFTETEFPLFELENFHYTSGGLMSSQEPSTMNENKSNRSSSSSTNSNRTGQKSVDDNNISPIPTNISSAAQLETFLDKSGIVGGRRMSTSSDNINTVEPIYAVVDLKNKYARRARMLELQEQMATALTDSVGAKDKARPNSIHCVTSGDYEEVLNFSSECLDESDDDEEDENIYEPINIPEHPYNYHCHNQRHALWKYFPRLNIDALLEMARNRNGKNRHHHHHHHHHHRNAKQDLLPNEPVNEIDQQQQQIQQKSPFSDFRKRMGNHRKSIKMRMKKLYSGGSRSTSDRSSVGNNSVIIKERNAFSDDELDSQGATGSTSGTSENSLKSACGSASRVGKPTAAFVFNEFDKYRRGEKQLFGSLSRLKKPRTSTCVNDENDDVDKNGDEIGIRKKKMVSKDLIKNDKRNQKQELRRGLIRSSGRKKDSCHSKFLD